MQYLLKTEPDKYSFDDPELREDEQQTVVETIASFYD